MGYTNEKHEYKTSLKAQKIYIIRFGYIIFNISYRKIDKQYTRVFGSSQKTPI